MEVRLCYPMTYRLGERPQFSAELVGPSCWKNLRPCHQGGDKSFQEKRHRGTRNEQMPPKGDGCPRLGPAPAAGQLWGFQTRS